MGTKLRELALSIAVDTFERHVRRAYISDAAPAIEGIRRAVLSGMRQGIEEAARRVEQERRVQGLARITLAAEIRELEDSLDG